MNLISQVCFSLATASFGFLIAAVSPGSLLTGNPTASAIIVMMLPLNIAVGISFNTLSKKPNTAIPAVFFCTFGIVFFSTIMALHQVLLAVSSQLGNAFVAGMFVATLIVIITTMQLRDKKVKK